jgi:hypothetical protein
MYVLIVDCSWDYDGADPHGPFETVAEGRAYAERYRAKLCLPIEATPENNEAWTDLGWYFGIKHIRNEA